MQREDQKRPGGERATRPPIRCGRVRLSFTFGWVDLDRQVGNSEIIGGQRGDAVLLRGDRVPILL